MSLALTVRAMVDAGCTAEQILAVVEALEAAAKPDKRSAAAKRQARYRERQRKPSNVILFPRRP